MRSVRASADPVQVARAFAELAAVASEGPFSVADLAQRLVDVSVDLLDVWAAGMLVDDPGSDPKLLASSTHQVELLELVQVRTGEGPCLAAMRRDAVVVVEDVSEVERDWPEWTAGARALGVTRAYGIPMRVRGTVVGALNTFVTTGEPLGEEDLRIAEALAEVATVGLVQHRAVQEATTLAGQLQNALDSRVVIEQAKGRIAERRGVSVADAFVLLRGHARSRSRPLSEVARAVVEGQEAELA